MAQPLPDPVPVTIAGMVVQNICDTDMDTCVFIEKTTDDDHVRLVAKDKEVVTANVDEVKINAGYIESQIDTLSATTTLAANQKIIKLDLISADEIFTLPPCATNEGRQYTIIRIDTNVGYTATVVPTLGEKINNVVDEIVELSTGCHFTIQCVGETDGWYIGL